MNPEFQKALVEFLVRYQKVSIPDLGKFYLEPRDYNNSSNTNLSPTKYSIEHQNNGQDNILKFEDFLMNMFRFGKTKAQQFIVQSVKQIHDILNKEDKLVCRDLGEFVKDGDQIKFIGYDNYINDQSFGLPIVKLIPIVRTYDEKKALLESTKRPKKQQIDRSKKSNIGELLLITLLLALCIGALWMLLKAFSQDKPNHQIDHNEIPNHSNIPEEAGVKTIDSSNFDSQYDAINSTMVDTYQYEIIIPVEDTSSIISQGFGKECIVIVGSFQRDSNRQRMIDKLNNLGYKIHTEAYGEFSRVGVRFDCLTQDLYNMLFVLKGEIDEKSWILKY